MNNKDQLSKYIGAEKITVVEAMECIDANAKGILFITDHQGMLKGSLTDGDVRRWILKGGKLNASVISAMTTEPKYLFSDEAGKAESLMRRNGITALPIVNRERKIEDIVFLSEAADAAPRKPKKNLSDAPVVIMAGGKGTRLRPYTKILPKPLIPIGDTPIVERIIHRFTEYGIQQFYMTVNYKKNMIRSYFSELNPPYEIKYVEEKKPLGTGGGIKLIEENFEKPLFVTNCDALILTDYGDLYDYHVQSENSITMVSAVKNITIPYGVLHSGNEGELLSIEEKPKLSYFINTGMYVINPDMIDLIPDDVMFHMTQLIEEAIKRGDKVGVYPVSEDSFLDMGEFDEMKRMEEKLNIVSE